ncbi:MAG: peptide deformylase [Oceanidesulfovibrio sp.]
MALQICTYPDPVLSRTARSVDEITPELVQLAKEMSECMYLNQGIGLAAPQVGESIRLIVVDVSGPEERTGLITLFNPVIASYSGEVESDEGCLSLPNFNCTVNRAATVTVRGQDIDGNDVTIDAEGLLAICLQHEIDHLEGTLLLNRVGRIKKSMYEKKVKKLDKKRQEA